MRSRLSLTLSDVPYERLREESRRTGISMAELIRRAIDEMDPESTVG